MTRMGRMSVLMALAIMCSALTSSAQDRDATLKGDVERRFDVLPLRDGLALRPKTPLAGVRSVEITGGTIAIDGQPATGSELRQKLGPEADQVLQLSYLADAARRALFAPAAPTPAPPPAAPAAPDTPGVSALP